MLIVTFAVTALTLFVAWGLNAIFYIGLAELPARRRKLKAQAFAPTMYPS